MDQGTIAFLSLFVICILFLEQKRCKCDDEVEGHSSIPWWVFLVAGIWVVCIGVSYYLIRRNSKGALKFKAGLILTGPLFLLFGMLGPYLMEGAGEGAWTEMLELWRNPDVSDAESGQTQEQSIDEAASVQMSDPFKGGEEGEWRFDESPDAQE
tara:strand:- start:227 stop:688 length:462 start_codon:yes stop_codon:yes gene_type:complete